MFLILFCGVHVILMSLRFSRFSYGFWVYSLPSSTSFLGLIFSCVNVNFRKCRQFCRTECSLGIGVSVATRQEYMSRIFEPGKFCWYLSRFFYLLVDLFEFRWILYPCFFFWWGLFRFICCFVDNLIGDEGAFAIASMIRKNPYLKRIDIRGLSLDCGSSLSISF